MRHPEAPGVARPSPHTFALTDATRRRRFRASPSSPLLSSLRCSRIRTPTLSDRRRVAEAYPQSRDGKTTLFPFTRFFLVAKRPSLLEVYGEYAAYHDHQLTKGWKS